MSQTVAATTPNPVRTIRVLRVLVYEGPEDWVNEMLAKTFVQPDGTIPPALHAPRKLYERERWTEFKLDDE